MKKTELIQKLQELEGDPEIELMTNGWENRLALLVHKEPWGDDIVLMEIKRERV